VAGSTGYSLTDPPCIRDLSRPCTATLLVVRLVGGAWLILGGRRVIRGGGWGVCGGGGFVAWAANGTVCALLWHQSTHQLACGCQRQLPKVLCRPTPLPVYPGCLCCNCCHAGLQVVVISQAHPLPDIGLRSVEWLEYHVLCVLHNVAVCCLQQ
jgi:hypothetical protein